MIKNSSLYIIAAVSLGIAILREIYPSLRFDGISLTLLGISAIALSLPRIIEILPPLKRAKYKDFEVEFEKEIKTLENQVVEIEQEAIKSEIRGTSKYPPLHSTYVDEYQSIMASSEPNMHKVLRSAILTEKVILQAANDLEIDIGKHRTPSSIIKLLVKEEFITPKEQEVFNAFWKLRNKVVHGHLAEITDNQTTRIMSLLWRLITIFG